MKKLELMEERIVATIQKEIGMIGQLLHANHLTGPFRMGADDSYGPSTSLSHAGRTTFSDIPAGNAFTLKPARSLDEIIDLQTGSTGTVPVALHPTATAELCIEPSAPSSEACEIEQGSRKVESLQEAEVESLQEAKPSHPALPTVLALEESSVQGVSQLIPSPSRRGTLIAYEEDAAEDDADDSDEDSQEKQSILGLSWCVRTARCNIRQECSPMFFGVRSFDKYSGNPGSRTIHPHSTFMAGARAVRSLDVSHSNGKPLVR